MTSYLTDELQFYKVMYTSEHEHAYLSQKSTMTTLTDNEIMDDVLLQHLQITELKCLQKE